MENAYNIFSTSEFGETMLDFSRKQWICVSFLKCYTHNDYINSLMHYYCHIRLNNILPTEYSIHNSSPVTTPYYEAIINIIRNILHIPGFPSIPKEKIYRNMLTNEKSSAELQYPTLNWQKIWSNYQSLCIYAVDKEIIYKYLHMCLATKRKLFSMDLIESNNC